MGYLKQQPFPVVNLHKENQKGPGETERQGSGVHCPGDELEPAMGQEGQGRKTQRDFEVKNEPELPGDKGRLDTVLFAPSCPTLLERKEKGSVLKAQAH